MPKILKVSPSTLLPRVWAIRLAIDIPFHRRGTPWNIALQRLWLLFLPSCILWLFILCDGLDICIHDPCLPTLRRRRYSLWSSLMWNFRPNGMHTRVHCSALRRFRFIERAHHISHPVQLYCVCPLTLIAQDTYLGSQSLRFLKTYLLPKSDFEHIESNPSPGGERTSSWSCIGSHGSQCGALREHKHYGEVHLLEVGRLLAKADRKVDSLKQQTSIR